jgi:hypothetical protein
MSKKDLDFGKAFPYEYLGLDGKATANNQYLSDCPFCGKESHFYISSETGRYECKVCNESGNVYTFIRHFYKNMDTENDSKVVKAKLRDLSQDRGLKESTLLKFGMRYFSDQNEWIIPVRNLSGEIVTFRIYHPATVKTKGKGRALTGIPLSMGGLETVKETTDTIWLLEGEWDAMAFYEMAEAEDVLDTNAALWLPGAGTFKESWLDVFNGKRIVLVYDKDRAGFSGRKKAASILQEAGIKEDKILTVDWTKLADAKDGFDLRDFYTAGNSLDDLLQLVVPVPKEEFVNRQENINEILQKFPHISERKLTWEEVLQEFKKWYSISDRLAKGLKMIVANMHSLNIKDTTPNWQHIISPAGSAKTEWISAFGSCAHVHIMSNASSKSLVSGFATRKGNDPSLIPAIIGKCLMIKDFTEILQMHRGDQEEMMGVLRGAYDGYIVKQFGNGVIRKYENCQFNIVSACTKAIYSDNKAAMGERFLKFGMIEGNNFEGIDEVLIMAAGQTGTEKSIREAVQAVIKEFCEVRFEYTELPQLSKEDLDMLSALSQILAHLRAQVETLERTDILMYRPQIEYGTRPMKVLSLNLRCLGMVNGAETNYAITDEDRMIVIENGISSMTPFTFEIARALYKAGEDGLSHPELLKVCKLENRSNTLIHYRGLLEAVEFVESFQVEEEDANGRVKKVNMYKLSAKGMKLWKRAKIEEFLGEKGQELDDIPKQKNRMKEGKFRIGPKKDK